MSMFTKESHYEKIDVYLNMIKLDEYVHKQMLLIIYGFYLECYWHQAPLNDIFRVIFFQIFSLWYWYWESYLRILITGYMLSICVPCLYNVKWHLPCPQKMGNNHDTAHLLKICLFPFPECRRCIWSCDLIFLQRKIVVFGWENCKQAVVWVWHLDGLRHDVRLLSWTPAYCP